jgi:hypothetical protein
MLEHTAARTGQPSPPCGSVVSVARYRLMLPTCFKGYRLSIIAHIASYMKLLSSVCIGFAEYGPFKVVTSASSRRGRIHIGRTLRAGAILLLGVCKIGCIGHSAVMFRQLLAVD